MTTLVANFTPPNSGKRYEFKLDANTDLDTAIAQFRLDLPSKDAFNRMRLREMNRIDPKSDPKITGADFFAALKLLQQEHPLKEAEYDCLYLAKKQLSPTRIRNVFDVDQPPIELNYQDFWFYIAPKPNSSQTTAVTTTVQNSTAAKPISAIKDFKTLQKRALILEHDYQEVLAGAEHYQKIMDHADEINIWLTKLNEQAESHQQTRQKQHEFLKQHFGQYLQTDQQKLAFLQNLLFNVNQPTVQNIIKGKPQALWHLVKAVCDYD